MARVLIAGRLDGDAAEASLLELVTAARSTGGDSPDIVAAIAGGEDSNPPDLPVQTLYFSRHEKLGESDSATFDAATSVLTAAAKEIQPGIVLFARTDAASMIAPRLAMRLGGTFSQDCTAIEAASGSVTVTRPVYGGNANARYRLNGPGPHVIVVRPGAYEAADGSGEPAELVKFDPTPHIGDARSTLIRTVQEEREGVRLEDAEVVVSGGRGLGGPEPFEQLGELANLLGGAVGASRAACDAGWIDHSHQVGLTGKSVSPRLYLSFGISGASQHMAGCSSARNIVAVNTDPDASIFSDARFGVVGDWKKVLPALISAVRDIS